MDIHLISYYIGIIILVLTHIYMLNYPAQSANTIVQHSYMNLFASGAIAYYFMNKEHFIDF